MILVEGETDKIILERVLEDLEDESTFEIFVTRGKDAARPIARRLLGATDTVVVFVYDSDTADRNLALSEQRS